MVGGLGYLRDNHVPSMETLKESNSNDAEALNRFCFKIIKSNMIENKTWIKEYINMLTLQNKKKEYY